MSTLEKLVALAVKEPVITASVLVIIVIYAISEVLHLYED